MSDLKKVVDDLAAGSVMNPIELPSLVSSKAKNVSPKSYTVKILKADLDVPDEALLLQTILTQGICSDAGDVLILDRHQYSDKSSFFMVVTYLERVNK